MAHPLNDSCEIQPFPRSRRLVLDAGWNAWRRHMMHGFLEVDAKLAIEVEIDGHKIPMMHFLRGINRRSCFELHQEIRVIQSSPERSQGMGVIRYFSFLPTFLRRLVYLLVERNPRWMKRTGGTVGLTSVGMFGTRSGWGLGMPVHSLAVMVGGIAQKPGVVDSRIEVREYLDLTLSFDHNIVDGAPAARFAQKFADLIESGWGLELVNQ